MHPFVSNSIKTALGTLSLVSGGLGASYVVNRVLQGDAPSTPITAPAIPDEAHALPISAHELGDYALLNYTSFHISEGQNGQPVVGGRNLSEVPGMTDRMQELVDSGEWKFLSSRNSRGFLEFNGGPDYAGLSANAWENTQTGEIVVNVAGLEFDDVVHDGPRDLPPAIKTYLGIPSDQVIHTLDYVAEIEQETGKSVTTITGQSTGTQSARAVGALLDKQVVLLESPGEQEHLAENLAKLAEERGLDVLLQQIEQRLHDNIKIELVSEVQGWNSSHAAGHENRFAYINDFDEAGLKDAARQKSSLDMLDGIALHRIDPNIGKTLQGLEIDSPSETFATMTDVKDPGGIVVYVEHSPENTYQVLDWALSPNNPNLPPTLTQTVAGASVRDLVAGALHLNNNPDHQPHYVPTQDTPVQRTVVEAINPQTDNGKGNGDLAAAIALAASALSLGAREKIRRANDPQHGDIPTSPPGAPSKEQETPGRRL